MKEQGKKAILVIDDEENLRHMLQVMLKKQGYQVECAADGREGLNLALSGNYQFILCDLRMPVLDGTGFLAEATAGGVAGTIIMMSAYGTLETAIECMKNGAYDYISKPFKNDEILLVLRKAEERERLKSENRRLKEELLKENSFEGMISRNPKMVEIFSIVQRAADFPTSILILGESGTGKELVARALHNGSSRNTAPFIALNCAAIPEHLLESELFGHAKGAFTSASCDKAGLFEEAEGGTIFLDEVAEMPLSLQVKLLRVLQGEDLRRLGESTGRKVNVRVVSATSRNLQDEIRQGRFREDLYFRLNVISVTLPPLRERMEDLPLLVTHMLGKYGRILGKAGITCPPDVLKLLLNHSWPGNVRELENVIQRMLLLCQGSWLHPADLPEQFGRSGSGSLQGSGNLSIKIASEQIERELIEKALEKTGGNRTHAARLLEISHRSLLYKLKDYGIE